MLVELTYRSSVPLTEFACTLVVSDFHLISELRPRLAKTSVAHLRQPTLRLLPLLLHGLYLVIEVSLLR